MADTTVEAQRRAMCRRAADELHEMARRFNAWMPDEKVRENMRQNESVNQTTVVDTIEGPKIESCPKCGWVRRSDTFGHRHVGHTCIMCGWVRPPWEDAP